MTKHYCDRCKKVALSVKDLSDVKITSKNVQRGEDDKPSLNIEVCAECVFEISQFAKSK